MFKFSQKFRNPCKTIISNNYKNNKRTFYSDNFLNNNEDYTFLPMAYVYVISSILWGFEQYNKNKQITFIYNNINNEIYYKCLADNNYEICQQLKEYLNCISNGYELNHNKNLDINTTFNNTPCILDFIKYIK